MSNTRLVVFVLSQMLHATFATQCIRCAPGKFKSRDMLFMPCTLCPENTFSSVPGASTCDICAPFSSSAVGSSRCTFATCHLDNYNDGCLCPPGTSGPDGGPCSACAAGTYKNASGASPCDDCGSTKTSVPGSSSCFCRANFSTAENGECLPCMNGMISRENSTSCFCPNGTSLIDGRCARIHTDGLRLRGFVSLASLNASNASDFVDVDSLKQELTRSVALIYNISESLVQVVLTGPVENLQQQSGYSADVIILATSAADLARVVNQSSFVTPAMLQNVERSTLPISMNEGAIVTCADNEVSVSTACVCSKGYTRVRGRCVACAPGTSKSTAGDGACDTCSGNTFSRTGAALCSACPRFATTRQNYTSCACNTGFLFVGSTCRATEAVFMNITGTLVLPEGTFTALELQTILIDGLSAYLNVSSDFITVLVRTTQGAAPNTTNTNITFTDNNTASRRRSLLQLENIFSFIALLQIPLQDTATYAKVEALARLNASEIITIPNVNGYQILVETRSLVRGYFRDAMQRVELCPDGKPRRPDNRIGSLICAEKGEGTLPVLGFTVGGSAVLVLVMVAGIMFACHRGNASDKTVVAGPSAHTTYTRVSDTDDPPAYTQSSTNAYYTQALLQNPWPGVRPVAVHVPSTVSFEYNLLPNESI